MNLRKIAALGALATAAVAVPLALSVPANADVPRCAATMTDPGAATFTATQPRLVNHQFETVWTHDVTVKVNPNGTFSGTATVLGGAGESLPDETWTGSFGANNTISFTMTRPDTAGYESLDNGVADGNYVNHPTTSEPNGYVDVIDMKITAPVFASVSTTDMNHGQYVSTMGGGKAAAQSCAGMPLNSNKTKG